MSNHVRVLIVEDSEDDALLVLRELSKGEYEPAHERVDTPAAMEAALDAREWDIVLSDFTMPRFNALDALRILQERELDIPFLIVSGSIGEETAVAAMKAGAHDYIMKDRIGRLVPAVERELREAGFRRTHMDAMEKMCEQAALLDISPNAFIVRNGADRIVFWSKGAERLYGWTAKEAAGQTYSGLLCLEIHPEHEKALVVMEETGAWSGECRHRTRDGKQIVVESNWQMVGGGGDKTGTTLVVNTDITEKKIFEAQSLRAQRLESIGSLACGIAHDMNNILAPIAMAVEMLKGNHTDEDRRRILGIMEKSAGRGSDLMKTVLSFVRGIEGGRGSLNAKQIIAETEIILKGTLPKTITFHTDVSEPLGSLSGNSTQLIQVLINLCVNARDAMPDGGFLRLSARNAVVEEGGIPGKPDAPPGPYIVIGVSDTGTGIPPEIEKNIFEPFFTTKGIGRGTGLGLSTAFSIVKGHNGFITVTSVPGKGTSFDIYLPAGQPPPVEKPEREQFNILAGHGELILVVDDEISILEISRATLETFGYRVLTASNGAESMNVYRNNYGEVKAVILDKRMPIMDGPATAKMLRDFDPRVKIILASGGGFEDATGHEVAAAVQALLQKPFTVKTLLTTLKDVLAQPL